jgi:hypothetical protein
MVYRAQCRGIYGVTFIDFYKAFDAVPHNKLVSILSFIGMCERTSLWIAVFLTDRT